MYPTLYYPLATRSYMFGIWFTTIKMHFLVTLVHSQAETHTATILDDTDTTYLYLHTKFYWITLHWAVLLVEEKRMGRRGKTWEKKKRTEHKRKGNLKRGKLFVETF